MFENIISNMQEIHHERFGQATTPFNVGRLYQLLDDGKYHEAKLYIACRIAKSLHPLSAFVYHPSKKEVQPHTLQDIKQGFLPSSLPKMKVFGKQINVFDWWNTMSGLSYNVDSKLHAPLVYHEHGEPIINLMSPFPHQYKKQSAFHKETKEACRLIWKHVFEVWASRNRKTYEYLKQWISGAVTGQKMETILYLKGGQGIGKSSIIEFIFKYVLHHLCLINKDTTPFLSYFNYRFQGKILKVLEEAPS